MSVHLSNKQGSASKSAYYRSLPILTKLAKRYQQPNPLDPASSRDDYLDYGMAILGEGVVQMNDMVSKDDLDKGLLETEMRIILKIDARFEESQERIEERFQGIDNRFQGIDNRFQGIDNRFQEIDKRFQEIDNRFQEIDKRFQEIDRRFDSLELRMIRKIDALEDKFNLRFEAIDKRFEAIDERFEAINGRFDHLEGRFDNFQAVQRNGKRYKLYHRIEAVRAYKFNPDIGRCQWTVSPRFPKHLKAFRNLGNHAKGRWTAEELAELSPLQRKTKQDRALAALEELLDFYSIQVFTDDESESDATEIALSAASVDDHMEVLADEWGLEWYDITRIPDEEPNILAAKKRGSSFWEQRRAVRARVEN